MNSAILEQPSLRTVFVEALAEALLPWAPMLAAVVLYLWQLNAAPLWYDEAGSAWMAELPLARLVAATAGDTHPPLYFILLSGMQRLFGSSPAAMRLPSVLCALIVIALTHEIAKSLGLPPLARIIGLGLMVLSPFQLHFAQEARMYSLLQVEVLAMVLFALRRHWILLALASTAALWTHNYGLVYLAVIGAPAIVCRIQWPTIFGMNGRVLDRAQLGRATLAVAVPVLTLAPWLLVLAGQMQTVAAGYWIQPVTPGGIVYVLYTWLFGFTLPEWMQPTGVLVAAGFIIWLTVAAFRANDNAALSLHWLIVAPVTIIVGISVLWKPVLLFRGFAPGVPLLFLLAGWALARIRFSHRLYALVILAPLLATGIVGHYRWNPEHKEGAQRWATHLRAAFEPGDVIIHANEGTLLELHNQLGDLPQYILPRCAQNNLGALTAATRDAMGMQAVDPDAVEWRRAWFVWSWSPTVTQCEVDAAHTFLRTYPAHALVFPIRDDEYVEANIWLIVR